VRLSWAWLSSPVGWAGNGVAILFHEGSTIVVVLNALRLVAYQKNLFSEEGMMDTLTLTHISGIVAVIGALLYAIGDVLLLAPNVGPIRDSAVIRVDLKTYPKLQRRAKLFETMALLTWPRLAWGGLLGVFGTPLTLAGIWLVYYGLHPAGGWAALPPVLLFAALNGIGAFIHGSFIYLGENVQLLNNVNEDTRPLIIGVLLRQLSVMQISYIVLFAGAILGSIWFSVAVVIGGTRFPIWMAAVNPLTMTLVWLALKKILPLAITDRTEGAGFNIAYMVFFALMTATLW
jgi:hypothetical protein